MCPPIQNPRPLPIIPKLLSFRLANPWSISSLSCLGSSQKALTKERVPSRQSYDALIKNYHPPTTKGGTCPPLALSPFPSLDNRYSPPSLLPPSSFSLSRRHFVFLFISPWSPRKLNKPRRLSLQSRKLGRRIKSYSPPSPPLFCSPA